MSKKYVDLEKCTSEFRGIFERYKANRKNQIKIKNPPTIQMILDEQKRQVIDNQTEDEYLAKEFFDNLREEEEISEFLSKKTNKKELTAMKEKMKEKRLKFTKKSLLQTLITPNIGQGVINKFPPNSTRNGKYHFEIFNSQDLILPPIQKKENVIKISPKRANDMIELEHSARKALHVQENENALGYLQTRSTKENSIYNNERDYAYSSRKLMMKKKKVEDVIKTIDSIEDDARKYAREYPKNFDKYNFGSMILRKKFEYTLGKL